VQCCKRVLLQVQQSGITTGIGAAAPGGGRDGPARLAVSEEAARLMAEDRIT